MNAVLLTLNILTIVLAACFLVSPKGSAWLARILTAHAVALAAYQKAAREARALYRDRYAETMRMQLRAAEVERG